MNLASPRLFGSAALACAALVLSACGGGGGDGDPQGDGASQQYWPLTGLAAPAGASVAKPHRVFVVKIDNTSSSAPQLGLGSADMVVEELVEGGITRLAAFFYSDLPKVAGPVRSMRASDIGIVSPANATVVTSGAASPTIKRINAAGIHFIGENGDTVYRDNSRLAPYNVMADLVRIAKFNDIKPATPAAYLPWGEPGLTITGKKAVRLSADFGNHSSDWAYKGGTYSMTDSNMDHSNEFKADNVLVLKVKIGDAGYLDPVGYPVPETKLEGSGAAALFNGGRMVNLTWHKSTADGALTFTDANGNVLIPPGHTWIELVPAATGGVTYSKK